jgi:hypothetical protein
MNPFVTAASLLFSLSVISGCKKQEASPVVDATPYYFYKDFLGDSVWIDQEHMTMTSSWDFTRSYFQNVFSVEGDAYHIDCKVRFEQFGYSEQDILGLVGKTLLFRPVSTPWVQMDIYSTDSTRVYTSALDSAHQLTAGVHVEEILTTADSMSVAGLTEQYLPIHVM